MTLAVPHGSLLAKATKTILVAEAASIVTGIGVAYTLPKVMPRQLHKLQNVVAKYVVEPNLELAEAFTSNTDFLQSAEKRSHDKERKAKEKERLKHRSPEEREKRIERAHKFADPLTEVSLSGLGGLLGGWLAAEFYNAKTNHLRGNTFSRVVVNYGVDALVVASMATILSPLSKKLSNAGSQGLQAMGAEKDSADRAANYAVYWKIADVTGALAAICSLVLFNRGHGR